MKMDDFVPCPLCHGSAQLQRSELLALLRAEDLRQKLESNINELTSVSEAAQAAPEPRPGEFAQKVHDWNATLALWRRSAKE